MVQDAIAQLPGGSAVVVGCDHRERRITRTAQQRQAKKKQYFSGTSQMSHASFS